ncbi:MAG: hypothetical protein KDE52_00970 [Calditrichaeota bacterium]|nr:hypothetical protein [Calditrichota bacterium]MCB0268020.1 hypothetical protein [Calditrichota bacterium]MCB0285302.1 hypothetical protein [Calditrichota bacterium]MCB0298592.1 hypothetical protein [Calditrichota bacterium]MCB9067729.1 hypothetical protein [Calditrichia bacterium]
MNQKFNDIDAVITELYAVISGPAGQERDWDRERNLFFPGAKLIRTSIDDTGKPQALAMDMASYIENVNDYLVQNGFFEYEIARKTEIFGNVAHVFSTYEAKHRAEDAEPFKRGINSIQLFFDGERWWIINMIWDNERPGNPMPERYLESN